MTKTINPESIASLLHCIEEASRISIVAHTRPDGDAVGSSLGLGRFLQDVMGKEVRTMFANPWSDSLDFIFDTRSRSTTLVCSDDPDACREWAASCDLIFCLDCASLRRTDTLEPALSASAAPKILIDHHQEPDRDSFLTVFSETEISSTCELLFWILLALPQTGGDASRLPAFTLTALTAGMTTDTNNFANSVFPSTLEMASKALEAGVDRDGIIDCLYRSFRENRLRMTGLILQERMKILEGGIAYVVLYREDLEKYDIREGELEGVVNMPLTIKDVKMSVLIKEDGDLFRLSLRSKKGTSVYDFASKYFHGGGHIQASGGRLSIPDDLADRSAVATHFEICAKEFSGQWAKKAEQ